MGRRDRVRSGMIWTILGYIVGAFYGFISVPILINYFGKSNYGLIGLAMSVNVYLALMDMGLTATSIRYFSNWIAKGEKENVRKLFQTNLAFYGVVGIINAIVLFVIAFYGDSIFNVEPSQVPVLRNLMLILALNAVVSWYTSSFNQLIQGDEYVGWSQKVSLLPKLVQLAILFLTVTIHFSIELYYILTVFSIAIVTVPLMVRKIRIICPYVSFIPKFDKGIFWEIFPYSISIFSINIFQYSATNLRPIFMGMRCPVETITDYRIVYAISSVVAMIGSVFYSSMLPTVSKAVANNEEKLLNKIVYQGTLFVTIFLGFCNFGMISILPELLDVYVGESFMFLVPWIDLYLILNLGGHNQAISSIIFSGTDFKPITYFTIFSSVVCLMVCWFTIPYFQVGGVVFSVMSYVVLQLGFLYFYYWPQKMNISSIRILFKSVMPVIVIGGILSYTMRSLHIFDNQYLEIVLKGGLFAILYVSVIWIYVSKSDREELMKLAKIGRN